MIMVVARGWNTLPSSYRPHYFRAAKAFRVTWSNVFPARLPRIHHRSELTERDWENAVQELVNGTPKHKDFQPVKNSSSAL